MEGEGGNQKAMITLNWMRSASTGGCIWRQCGGDGGGGGRVIRKPWSHWTRPACYWATSAEWGREGGRRGDQKAMITLNEVIIHIGLHLGAEWGRDGGRGDLKAMITLNEVSMHRDYCYEGGKEVRGDLKAMITLNEVSIHIGLHLGAEWGRDRGRGDLKAMIVLNEVSLHRDYCYEGGKGGRGDLKAMIMLKLACTETTVMEEGGW